MRLRYWSLPALAVALTTLGVWAGVPSGTRADPNGEPHDDAKGGHAHVPT